jgi:hypothetical protein
VYATSSLNVIRSPTVRAVAVLGESDEIAIVNPAGAGGAETACSSRWQPLSAKTHTDIKSNK